MLQNTKWLLSKRVRLFVRQPSSLRSRCTIISVKKQPTRFKRRRLSSVVRKAITSYYTDLEQKEIEVAAKGQNVSKSSFVASAALKEARRLAH